MHRRSPQALTWLSIVSVLCGLACTESPGTDPMPADAAEAAAAGPALRQPREQVVERGHGPGLRRVAGEAVLLDILFVALKRRGQAPASPGRMGALL